MKHLFAFSLFLISTLANAQTVCDSLDFVSIKYSPFTDSIIIVHVENNNPNEIFSYPGFVLLNENGDTLAKESVFYFGIGEESVHSLDVRAGVHDPIDNFTGTLKLYSGFYETFECEWDLDQSLCADSPCDSVILGFQNWGGALVTGNFHWEVASAGAALVDSGSFTMTANEQFWFYGMCLQPGTYTYSLTALTQPSGGAPTLTVSSSSSFAAPSISAPLDWFNDPGAQIVFPFFDFCAEDPNAIESATPEGDIQVLRNGNEVVLRSSELIRSVLIYSTDGKLVGSLLPNATQVPLPTDLPTGVYLVQLKTSNGYAAVKVVR